MVDKKLAEIVRDDEFKEIQIERDSELGTAFKNLDSEKHLNKNTRLSKDEIGALLALEGLQDIGLLDPSIITVNRKLKELSISQDGKGRDEKVQMTASEREAKTGSGFLSGLKGMFQRRE